MIEDARLTDIAVTWVETLRARGVTVFTRGKRLGLSPKTAYGALNDAERGVLKRHKASILAVVNDRYRGRAAGLSVLPEVEPCGAKPEVTPAPAPTCAYCGQSPCIGELHVAFEFFHRDDHREIERRRVERTKEMFESLRRGLGPWEVR